MLIVTRPYSLQILLNEGLICVSEQELYAAQQLRAEQIRRRDEEKWRQAEQHQRNGQITQEQSESNARTLDKWPEKSSHNLRSLVARSGISSRHTGYQGHRTSGFRTYSTSQPPFRVPYTSIRTRFDSSNRRISHSLDFIHLVFSWN